MSTKQNYIGINTRREADLLCDIADQIEREHGEHAGPYDYRRIRMEWAIRGVLRDMERHVLGHEGMEDSPVHRWARELREALAGHEDEEVTDVATVRKDAYDAYEWVEAHGGLDAVKEEWRSRVPYDRHEERRQRLLDHIAECEEALGRRNERIQKLGKTIEFFQLNNSNFRHLLADVAERLGFTRFGDDYEPEDLLDALDRRLMPEGMEWPRFDDSEPVAFRDKGLDVHGHARSVEGVKFTQGGFVFISDDMGNTWWANDRGPMEYPEIDPDKRVKRPAPKVLDADGAEIREKCDVWWICEGDERGVHAERLRVETICPNGLIECSPYNGGTWVYLEPSELYVNKPVPSSDGRPLREGETVWDVDGHGPLVVRALPSEGEQLVVLDNGGTNFYRYPEQLTHERPDSWERIEGDANAAVCVYFGASVRDCENCDHNSWECSYDKSRDLVHRCKALAERGQ